MGLRSGLGGSTGEPLEERRWECIVLEAGVLGSLVVRWPLECALSPQPLETLPKSCSFAASYYPTGLILHHHPKLAHGAPPQVILLSTPTFCFPDSHHQLIPSLQPQRLRTFCPEAIHLISLPLHPLISPQTAAIPRTPHLLAPPSLIERTFGDPEALGTI